MKLGFDGLECDIGAFFNIILPNCGSLGPGMVEAILMLWMNKDHTCYNAENVPTLGANQ